MRRVFAVLLACLGLAAPMVVTASTAASAAPVLSPRTAQTAACNAGHVCIYQGDIWDDSPNHPKVYDFYYYGTYNVHNLIGDYTVLNCQTGGVTWDLNINNCAGGLWTDLTPTNSVRLYA